MAMLKMMTTTMVLPLMLAIVNCQPLKPADVELREPDRAVHDASRHRRRLAAYNIGTDNDDDDDDGVDDDDVRWLLAAASAVGVTSLMTMFAWCTCCPLYRKRHR